MSKTVGQQEFAEMLGLTTRQIQNLVKDGVVRQEANGRHPKYRIPDAIQQYIQHKVEAAREESRPKNDTRDRSEQLRGDLLALEVAQKLGQVMSVDQFRKARYDSDARVAAKIKALENRLAPAVIGTTDVQDGLERVKPLIAEVMDELYRGADIPDAIAPSNDTAA
jgi:phage terminase Nu1 subunit (DNA packaging protein)